MMSTLEVLRAARADIERDWWDGHHPRWPNPGSHCALVALADHCDPARHPAVGVVLNVIGAYAATPYEVLPIIAFNDSHSHSEVMALFDRAIAVEEARAAEFTTNTEPAEVVA